MSADSEILGAHCLPAACGRLACVSGASRTHQNQWQQIRRTNVPGCFRRGAENYTRGACAPQKRVSGKKLFVWPPSTDALLWRIVRPVGMAALF